MSPAALGDKSVQNVS